MLLLRALRNEHEQNEVRRAAYESLLLLYEREDFPDSLVEFDPAEDVDWLWIKQVEAKLLR